MSDPIHGWRLKCPECNIKHPTMLASHFGFDRNGTLSIIGVCRFCLREFTMEHDFDEIAGDVREAYNLWIEGGGQEQEDLELWESELFGDDDEQV